MSLKVVLTSNAGMKNVNFYRIPLFELKMLKISSQELKNVKTKRDDEIKTQ